MSRYCSGTRRNHSEVCTVPVHHIHVALPVISPCRGCGYRWGQPRSHSVAVRESTGQSQGLPHPGSHLQTDTGWAGLTPPSLSLSLSLSPIYQYHFTPSFILISLFIRSCEAHHTSCGVYQCSYCWYEKLELHSDSVHCVAVFNFIFPLHSCVCYRDIQASHKVYMALRF